MSGRLPPLTGIAERVLARVLTLDPECLAGLGELAPDLLAVEVRGTPWVLGLAPHAGGIAIVPADAPRATVSGDVPGLLAWLGRGREARVTLSGDADFARRFAAILRAGRPDVEEALSRVVGDVPAHYLGDAARTARAGVHQARASVWTAFGEYLQHERGALPSAPEFADFSADIEALRAGLDRLAARVDALTRR